MLVGATVGSVLAVVAALVGLGVWYCWGAAPGKGLLSRKRSRGGVGHPAPGPGPLTTLCITDIEGSTPLW